ncbi:MAG: DUF4349 domain-containing protein [Gemmatimonadales bacterium]
MKSLIFAATVVVLTVACDSGPSGDGARERSPSIALTGSEQDAASSPPVANQAGIGRIAEVAQAPAPPARDRFDSKAATTSATSTASAVAGAEQVAPSMLIRTGNTSIEVEKLDAAILKVRQLAQELGGYVANSSISGGRDQVRSATLELKIPAAKYDQAIGGLNNIGKVEAVNTSVEDVGEEFVDITARVTNAKRLEERLVNLLATRTGKLEDVLAVERELARVREEIERYEGRIRFLKTRAAVSTLSVTVHEAFPLLGQNPGDNPIIRAFKMAWRNFVGFVAWMIASLGVLVPVAVLLAGGWYVFLRYRKGR